MSEQKKILRVTNTSTPRGRFPDYIFWCPGCKCGHGVWVSEPNSGGHRWTFNGDMERPTFQPSLLLEGSETRARCHLFVTAGMLEFLGDCGHEFRGKRIPMEAF